MSLLIRNGYELHSRLRIGLVPKVYNMYSRFRIAYLHKFSVSC